MLDGTRCGRILVVEDDERLSDHLRGVLREAGFDVEAAADAAGALAAARALRPDAVVLDVCLPGLSGYEVCRVLKQERPDLPVLFMSGERIEPLDRAAGLLIGADDYLVKPFAADELLARLRSRLRRPPAELNGADGSLTKRELEVLTCLVEGLAQPAIAKRLVISPRTVATHVEHIFRKLGVRSQAQAVGAAYRRGLVGLDGRDSP
jgi:DNA-binding NarL/FixJ family response regulator